MTKNAMGTDALQKLLDVRDQELRALRTSSSWRITAPLRWVGDVARVWFRKSEMQQAAAFPLAKDYTHWIQQFEVYGDHAAAQLREHIAGFAQLPLFSVLLPLDNALHMELHRAVASVQTQIYPNWELCISLGSKVSTEVRAQVREWALAEPRIKWVETVEENASLNQAVLNLISPKSDWLIKISAKDCIGDKALYTAALALNRNKDCELLYADEDVLTSDGQRRLPFFKCAWNRELHYSRNLVGRFGIYRTSRVLALGGYSSEAHDAADFDLSLRYLEQIQAPHIVHLPYVLFHAGQKSAMGMPLGVAALDEHFARLGVAAKAENLEYGYRVRYALPVVLPQVSLIIPTRNGLTLLRQCVESIQEKTRYPNYDIIVVDNGSDDLQTLDYLAVLAKHPRVQVLRIDAPFNYSALNNAAVAVATGELVGLLNNDIEVISPDWLHEMVSQAWQADVGAVGARLWFPNGTLQHGGIVLGIHGWAAHAHNHFAKGSLGYQGRMALVSEFSAVTAACLLVKKSSYEAVGGLNEGALKISCNDVDFCLKLQRLGLRNVWTPFADLVHHESATRGFEDTPEKKQRFARELAYMQQHWQEVLANDPAYSPNLSLDAQDFSLAWPPRVTSLIQHVDLQIGQAPLYERLEALRQGQWRVAYLAENIHSSTFRYRAANMAQVLNTEQLDATQSSKTHTSAACFFWGDLTYAVDIATHADVLVISRVRYDTATSHVVQLFKAQGKKVWFDIDDWVFDTQAIDLLMQTLGQMPTDETLNYWYSVVARMAQTLRLCDGALTTNGYLAEKIAKFVNVPVRVIPNFINEAQWQASVTCFQRKLVAGFAATSRVRLGYFSGSATHNKDVALLASALEQVMAADERVDLVLVGPVDVMLAFGPRFGGYLKGHLAHRVQHHAFVDYLELPRLMAEVDYNLVPLQNNAFTDCKSELKFFDAAAVGTLTIASPSYTYARAIRHGQNGFLAQEADWEQVLLQAIALRYDASAYAAMSQAAYQDVQQRFTWKTQRDTILNALTWA